MAFYSVNELDRFDFQDCRIVDFSRREDGLEFTLEGLVVAANNSQNSHFTPSYAGTTTMLLKDGRILSGLLEGMKIYDADGNLKSETPDQELSAQELAKLEKDFAGKALWGMRKDSEEKGIFTYTLGMDDVPGEGEEAYFDTTPSYEVQVSFSQADVRWEKFLSHLE